MNIIRNPNSTSDVTVPVLTDATQIQQQSQERQQQEDNMNRINAQMTPEQINSSMGPIWDINGEVRDNYTQKDFVYNSYSDYRAPTFNEWTKTHDDNCTEESHLRISTKPMKYFLNQFNSPQVVPFMNYTLIGNQQTYNVRNDFERAEPTRLNPLYPVNNEPYSTTPFLGQISDSRIYADTGSEMRFGANVREHKSTVAITEKDFNRFNPGVNAIVTQNAGQFQQQKYHDGYFNYFESNNISLGNDSVPRMGISSRTLMDNILEMSGC
jgi:hypothetical protein